MSASSLEVAGELLAGLLDEETVNRLVANDATYVSLNPDHPELSRIMPWAGTAHGPAEFNRNIAQMFRFWQNEKFDVTAMFADGEDVAVFGNFVYRSNTLDHTVSSPFSVHIKVVDGQVSYLQFLEDTYATAASFRAEGTWTVHNDPAAGAFRL